MRRMIHYVVAVYTGKRANDVLNGHLSDPLFLVKMQINALKRLKVPKIKRVTFVVSPSSNMEADLTVVDFINNTNHGIEGVEIQSYLTDNNDHYSYGSWNDCIKKNLDSEMNFFLIEDDYIPSKNLFYLPFEDQLDEKTAYVCQLYTTSQPLHASISNGLMNLQAARDHYDMFGSCMSLLTLRNKEYSPGVMAQMSFLDHYPKMLYSIKDIASTHKQPFLNSKNKVSYYGNRNSDSLLEPYVNFIES